MVHLLVYYGLANAVALAVALALGYMGPGMLMPHFAGGFLGSLSATLWIGVAMFYFVYSGQAVNRAFQAGIASSDDALLHQMIKKKLFPLYICAILLLIAGSFLGATAQAKGSALTAHHVVSWLSCLAYWLAVYLSWDKITWTGRMIGKILADVEEIRRKKAAANPPTPAIPD